MIFPKVFPIQNYLANNSFKSTSSVYYLEDLCCNCQFEYSLKIAVSTFTAFCNVLLFSKQDSQADEGQNKMKCLRALSA